MVGRGEHGEHVARVVFDHDRLREASSRHVRRLRSRRARGGSGMRQDFVLAVTRGQEVVERP